MAAVGSNALLPSRLAEAPWWPSRSVDTTPPLLRCHCRWPYIAALPEGLPCGWALPPAELAATLAGLGSLADGWQPKIAAAAAALQQRCEAAAAAYGPELGGVTAAEVRWALGHVVSRCFGSGGAGCVGACWMALAAHNMPWRHRTCTRGANTLIGVVPTAKHGRTRCDCVADLHCCSDSHCSAAQVMSWRCCRSST